MEFDVSPYAPKFVRGVIIRSVHHDTARRNSKNSSEVGPAFMYSGNSRISEVLSFSNMTN